MSHFLYFIVGDKMIKFIWNGIEWSVADLGGGPLMEDIEPHSHSKNGYELHFITGGKGTLIAENREYNLKKGCFFVTGPEINHAHLGNSDNPLTDVFIYLQKTNSSKANVLGKAFLKNRFYFCNDFDISIPQLILYEHKNQYLDYETAVQGLIICLLTEITRIYLPDENNISIEADNLNIKRFVIIDNEFLYNQKVTLHSLSEKIGVCERQTQRLLKKYYGMSFREKKKQAEQYRQPSDNN